VNLDPQYHLPPGRQAAVDALTSERFSGLWWVTPRPEFVDSKLTQGIRRRALSEALDGLDDHYEETA
jgi:hypothetical protein